MGDWAEHNQGWPVIDLHRDPEHGTESEFGKELLSVLTRIALALETQNEIASRIRGGLQKLQEGPSARSESEIAPQPPAKQKNVPAKPAVRTYDDYREAGWDDNDNSLWEVKIDGKWVPANPLEAKLFNKRLNSRKGSN
jgi:hypothetical protein